MKMSIGVFLTLSQLLMIEVDQRTPLNCTIYIQIYYIEIIKALVGPFNTLIYCHKRTK
uniref:Uncharacterized protein n=1 Tax=Lepeophtheirus salmonis TaxID=72036 RepID=A0A0K2VG48_LEPSM